jgi:uncharacterized protein (DUF885 family)
MTGALPLSILEQKIDRWIARRSLGAWRSAQYQIQEARMKHLGILAASLAVTVTMTAMPAQAQAVAATTAQSPSQALAALFAASDEANLRRNPISALFRGDLRYADHLGNPLSDEYFAEERAAAVNELAALAAIDRASLTPEERISYDVFKWQRTIDLKALQPDMLALTAVRPIDHFNGIHAFFAELSTGEGAAPFKTVKDYDNGLSRIDDFVAITDTAIVRMRQGMASGVVQPRLVVQNVVDQLDQMLADGVEESAFYKPLTAFPASVPAAEQERLKGAYRQSISQKLRPALQRLRDFMANDYLPASRTTVGLQDMKGGAELYRYLVEVNTTTNLTPAEIHQIGLDEVKRLHAEMEKVKAQVGFTGTLQQFFEHIRTDRSSRPSSREWLQQTYVGIGKRLDATLPNLFSTLPKGSAGSPAGPGIDRKGRGARFLQSGYA